MKRSSIKLENYHHSETTINKTQFLYKFESKAAIINMLSCRINLVISFLLFIYRTKTYVCFSGEYSSIKMINQSHLYQNKISIALVPKIFNWPMTIKPTTLSSWSTAPVGALRARRCFAAIIGSNFRIESYPL